jgi:hypothetical protein
LKGRAPFASSFNVVLHDGLVRTHLCGGPAVEVAAVPCAPRRNTTAPSAPPVAHRPRRAGASRSELSDLSDLSNHWDLSGHPGSPGSGWRGRGRPGPHRDAGAARRPRARGSRRWDGASCPASPPFCDGTACRCRHRPRSTSCPPDRGRPHAAQPR